ncbi:MAG TPA: hypothetical protein VFF16_10850 [Telluria sp.]|nr:hypothetical protein [Telluria sp.]
MKPVLKVLLVCLLLCAVPLQGFAAATMLLCAPARAAAPARAVQPDADSCHSAEGKHAGAGAEHHCASCAACSVGPAIAPAWGAPLAGPLAPAFLPIPFQSRHVPDALNRLPERPPRPTFA